MDQQLQKKWVDGIPVQWVLPRESLDERRLIVFLPSFGGSNQQVADLLIDIADRGSIGLSIDPWQHGDRGSESRDAIFARVFSAFRKNMWPILGQTSIDILRVIDWAIAEFHIQSPVRIGGLSMGGDVAIAAAGIDTRIERVFAVVATPDWLRPGMRDLMNPDTLIAQGEADDFAQFFFDSLNPMSHLERYRRNVRLTFLCGVQDNHVPPDGAERFKHALAVVADDCFAQVDVQLVEGMSHMDSMDRALWWPRCLSELTGR